MNADHPDYPSRGDELPPDEMFERSLASLRAVHVLDAELNDLVDDPLSCERAVVHIRSCGLCLEQLASRLEDIVIDDPTGSDVGADWRRLQPFLEHDEPVLRAAAARATVALELKVPPVIQILDRLGRDRDPLVAACASESLEELRPVVEDLVLAAASNDSRPDVARRAAASVWGEHQSADGRWRYSVAETGHDEMQITCWTEDESLAGATVTIEFLRRATGDRRSIALQLWKVEGKQRWERTWVGSSSAVVGYELRVLGPGAAE